MAGTSDIVDTCVANDTHDEGRMASSNATVIFLQGHILDPEQSVSDRPALMPLSQKSLHRRGFHRTTGDRVGHRRVGLAFDGCLAFEFQKLTQTRPVAGVDSDRGGRQRAAFNATTAILDRGSRPPCFTRLAFGIGGPVLILNTGPSEITKA
jgi:hypothetical protein